MDSCRSKNKVTLAAEPSCHDANVCHADVWENTRTASKVQMIERTFQLARITNYLSNFVNVHADQEVP